MKLSEFIYTVLLGPRPLRSLVNRAIQAILPKSVRVGPAIIHLNPRDPVISGALTFGLYERDELAFVASILRAGGTIVDVGANVGLYTAVAMHHVGGDGRIVAFEPHHESAGFLAETVRANAALCGSRCPQVDIVEVAAAASDGEANLFCNPENKGDNRLYVSSLTPDSSALLVQTRTIDSVLRDRQIAAIDFLKLDVQGYEREVIYGARDILRNSPNVIVLSELWPAGIKTASNCDWTGYIELLEDLDFHIYELGPGKLKLLQGRDAFVALVSQLRGRRYTNIVCTKRPFPMGDNSAFPFVVT